jgi:DUF4097 and DUF4098 domain-containing protein YvlB
MIRQVLRAALFTGAIIAAGAAAAACDVNVGDGNFNMGLASGRASDTWTRTYKVAPAGQFELRNVNGTISVEPAAQGADLEVKAERIARSSTDEAARELLKKIEIHEEASADRVSIETRAPKTWGRDGHEVKYTVKLPAGVRLDARNVNGSVELHRLAGQATVQTTNGGIKGDALAGQLDARTTNGGIDVGLAAVSGTVSLATTNGGISLGVPAGVAADLSARVTNGGIHVDDALKFEATGEQTRRRVEGKLNGGGRRIEVATTNGGISLHAQ